MEEPTFESRTYDLLGVTYEQWKHQRPSGDCLCEACYKFLVKDDAYERMVYDEHRPEQFMKLLRQHKEEWRKSCVTYLRDHPVVEKKHHVGNGKPKGLWVGTLTMAPTDPYNEHDMVNAIKKIFRQQTSPVVKFSWYLEYTENNLPHIHFIYRTQDGGRILSKVFSRIWPIWNERVPCGNGHRGGYHRICADEEAYLQYIQKDQGRHETQW